MKGVLMTKMVQELNLTNLTPEIDLSEMRIMTAEINRPALQLTGYLELLQMNVFRSLLCRVHISDAASDAKENNEI